MGFKGLHPPFPTRTTAQFCSRPFAWRHSFAPDLSSSSRALRATQKTKGRASRGGAGSASAQGRRRGLACYPPRGASPQAGSKCSRGSVAAELLTEGPELNPNVPQPPATNALALLARYSMCTHSMRDLCAHFARPAIMTPALPRAWRTHPWLLPAHPVPRPTLMTTRRRTTTMGPAATEG